MAADQRVRPLCGSRQHDRQVALAHPGLAGDASDLPLLAEGGQRLVRRLPDLPKHFLIPLGLVRTRAQRDGLRRNHPVRVDDRQALQPKMLALRKSNRITSRSIAETTGRQGDEQAAIHGILRRQAGLESPTVTDGKTA